MELERIDRLSLSSLSKKVSLPCETRGVDMGTSLTVFIYVVWIFMAGAALFAVGWSARRAWRDPAGQMIKWRFIKVMSAAFALMGFVLLVLNFEQVLKSTLVADADRS